MSDTSDESNLRAKAREVLRAGKLPNERPRGIWGGPGIGERCTVCDVRIDRHEPELELQYGDPDNSRVVLWRGAPVGASDESARNRTERATYHVHVRCFAAWEFERRNGHALPETGEQGIMNPDERNAANGARVGGG